MLQQLEGHVVAPQVFGKSLRINPLLVIFALLMGGRSRGLVGAFIALPIAAIVRESVVYLHRHLRFQSGICRRRSRRWRRTRRCPECARPVARGADRIAPRRDRARGRRAAAARSAR